MNRRSPRTTILAMLVTAGLALAACGSDSSETTTAATDTTATTIGIDSAAELTKDGPVDGVRRLWIKPELVDCVGEVQQRCMQVAESEGGEYYFFYDQIGGFDFEEGTGYVIDVQVDEIDDPPADAGTLQYTLIEIIEQG